MEIRMMAKHLPQKPNTQLLIYQAENGETKLGVRLEDETVWLTQKMIAKLYQTTKQNISLHIQNVYKEGELESEATVKKYLTVRQEGDREVTRMLDYYNLDMIISVGYRVGVPFYNNEDKNKFKQSLFEVVEN